MSCSDPCSWRLDSVSQQRRRSTWPTRRLQKNACLSRRQNPFAREMRQNVWRARLCETGYQRPAASRNVSEKEDGRRCHVQEFVYDWRRNTSRPAHLKRSTASGEAQVRVGSSFRRLHWPQSAPGRLAAVLTWAKRKQCGCAVLFVPGRVQITTKTHRSSSVQSAGQTKLEALHNTAFRRAKMQSPTSSRWRRDPKSGSPNMCGSVKHNITIFPTSAY